MKSQRKMSILPNKKKHIGILGFGEIGTSIAGLYHGTDHELVTKDKVFDGFNKKKQLDILHICIPASKDFIKIVSQHAGRYCAGGLVIIHSTVPVGTTEAIIKHHKFTVHSPVRGKHPNLLPSLKNFTKYIGADFAGAGRLALEHLQELGVPAVVFRKSRTTELMKLLSTTYYAHCIAFHDYAKKLCDKEGLEFDRVMTHPNNTYNQGYINMDMKAVVRPILEAPEDSKIGGHCLIPNAKMLKDQFGEDDILKVILKLQ